MTDSSPSTGFAQEDFHVARRTRTDATGLDALQESTARIRDNIEQVIEGKPV